jgi:hypothetical protein
VTTPSEQREKVGDARPEGDHGVVADHRQRPEARQRRCVDVLEHGHDRAARRETPGPPFGLGAVDLPQRLVDVPGRDCVVLFMLDLQLKRQQSAVPGEHTGPAHIGRRLPKPWADRLVAEQLADVLERLLVAVVAAGRDILVNAASEPLKRIGGVAPCGQVSVERAEDLLASAVGDRCGRHRLVAHGVQRVAQPVEPGREPSAVANGLLE